MNINIAAKNFKLTAALESFIEDRFTHLEKLIDPDKSVRVTLEVNNRENTAEVILYSNGSLIKKEVADQDLYIAIDILANKVKQQINKTHVKPSRITYEKTDRAIEHQSSFSSREIVKRKQFDMKPMTEEEAILQMEMLRHQTFMFFNIETESMCLLYKRRDGHLGIIESMYP